MKYRSFLIVYLCVIFNSVLNAQQPNNTNSQLGNIFIAVSDPEIPKSINELQKEKIKNKVIKSVNKTSLSAVNKNSDFTIKSSFQIFDDESFDGLRKKVVVNCEVYLRIEQSRTKNIFSTYSQEINGIGSSKEDAINNAIKRMSFEKAKFNAFIKKGKNSIYNYYEINCNNIISKIQVAYNNKNYKKAIILSNSIPSEVGSCYLKAQKIAQKSYENYRDTYCKVLILKGKAALAQNNFKLAGKYFSYVDPRSSCYEEAKELLNQVNTQFTENQQQQQQYNFELLQLFAVTEILTEYYGNQVNIQPSNNVTNENYSTINSNGTNLFLIMVADTQDEKIGKSTEKDMISVTNLFRRASKELGIGYSENMLYASTFDKRNIINSINKIPTKRNDIVVFYYSGHGFNNTKRESAFPTMYLDGEDILLEEVHNLMKDKNARLTLTIGDLCNSIPNTRESIESEKEDVHKSSLIFDKKKLERLFLQAKGEIISTSSKKGQMSFCVVYPDGQIGNGQFTNAFLNTFADATSQAKNKYENLNWENIFSISYNIAKKETERIKNQDGARGQFGFNKVVIE